MLTVKYTGNPPGFWVCVHDRPIVSAYEVWEATGQTLAPNIPPEELERLAQAALYRRGMALYPPGTTLECHNCGTVWASEGYLVGYAPGKGRKARLVDFSWCPVGHFNTHWVRLK